MGKSMQSKITAIYKQNPEIKVADLAQIFKDTSKNTLKQSLYRAKNPPKKKSKVIVPPQPSWEEKQEVMRKINENTAQSTIFSTTGGGAHTSPSKPINPAEIMKELALQGNYKAAEFMIRNPSFFEYKTDVPMYDRPDCFHKKQHQIVDAIMNPKVKMLFIEGVQRAGKSTAIFNALHELVINNKITKKKQTLQFDLMAGKGDQAQRILRDLMKDPIICDLNRELIHTKVADKCVWFDGSMLACHETTVADIKGGDSDVVWIDEFDVAIKKNGEAVMTAFLTMRALENMKIIMSANMDKGPYLAMRDRFIKRAENNDEIIFISILTEDCPHLLERSENDELLMDIGEVIVDKNFMRRRLQNIDTGSGDQFDHASLSDAYDIYETFIATEFVDNPINESDFNILAIDPSNTGHPFGWFLGGIKRNILFEHESGMMEMGLDDYGQKWTPERINLFFLKKCKQYHVKYVVCENNTYGAALIIYLKQHYGQNRCLFQQFAGEGKFNSRSNFLSVARKVFDERSIALKNPDIKNQLVIYDPTERDKEKFKGDIADAVIHFIWKTVGGMSYISNEGKKTRNKMVMY